MLPLKVSLFAIFLCAMHINECSSVMVDEVEISFEDRGRGGVEKNRNARDLLETRLVEIRLLKENDQLRETKVRERTSDEISDIRNWEMKDRVDDEYEMDERKGVEAEKREDSSGERKMLGREYLDVIDLDVDMKTDASGLVRYESKQKEGKKSYFLDDRVNAESIKNGRTKYKIRDGDDKDKYQRSGTPRLVGHWRLIDDDSVQVVHRGMKEHISPRAHYRKEFQTPDKGVQITDTQPKMTNQERSSHTSLPRDSGPQLVVLKDLRNNNPVQYSPKQSESIPVDKAGKFKKDTDVRENSWRQEKVENFPEQEKHFLIDRKSADYVREEEERKVIPEQPYRRDVMYQGGNGRQLHVSNKSLKNVVNRDSVAQPWRQPNNGYSQQPMKKEKSFNSGDYPTRQMMDTRNDKQHFRQTEIPPTSTYPLMNVEKSASPDKKSRQENNLRPIQDQMDRGVHWNGSDQKQRQEGNIDPGTPAWRSAQNVDERSRTGQISAVSKQSRQRVNGDREVYPVADQAKYSGSKEEHRKMGREYEASHRTGFPKENPHSEIRGVGVYGDQAWKQDEALNSNKASLKDNGGHDAEKLWREEGSRTKGPWRENSDHTEKTWRGNSDHTEKPWGKEDGRAKGPQRGEIDRPKVPWRGEGGPRNQPLSGESGPRNQPLSGESGPRNQPLSGESGPRNQPLSGESGPRNQPLSGESGPRNQPLSGESGPRNQPLSGESGPRNQPLNGEGGPRNQPLSGESGPRNQPLSAEGGPRNQPLSAEGGHTKGPWREEGGHRKEPLGEEDRHTKGPWREEGRYTKEPWRKNGDHTEKLRREKDDRNSEAWKESNAHTEKLRKEQDGPNRETWREDSDRWREDSDRWREAKNTNPTEQSWREVKEVAESDKSWRQVKYAPASEETSRQPKDDSTSEIVPRKRQPTDLSSFRSAHNQATEDDLGEPGKTSSATSLVQERRPQESDSNGYAKGNEKSFDRDHLKAEEAVYFWGMEKHRGMDGNFQYAKVPEEKSYEYGYRMGNPWHMRERHHQSSGVTSRTKVNWEDENGDFGDQYWEFNHGESDGRDQREKHNQDQSVHGSIPLNF